VAAMLCRFDPGSGYKRKPVPCPTDCASGQAGIPARGTEPADFAGRSLLRRAKSEAFLTTEALAKVLAKAG